MRTVKIDNNDAGWWLYNGSDEWKEYCAVDSFNETYVIHGNRDYNTIEEATWYTKAAELLADMDQSEREEVERLYPEYTKEQFVKLYEAYNKGYRDEDDLYVEVLNTIFPQDKFDTATIRGYSQGEWNNVLYKVGENVDISLLEEMYFGHITELIDESEEGCTAIVTHDELWKAERENTLEKFLRDALDIPKDEEIEVYESDGYIQQTKWKKVEV